MTAREVLLWSLAAIINALVLLLAITAMGRALRHRREERRGQLRDELRPSIVAILAEPDEAPPLPALRGRAEDIFEVLAFDYLAKVRGESRDALVRQLEERGAVDSAERRLGRPGSVGQAAAAELLGRCGLSRSREPLAALLNRRSPELRSVGARALGRLDDPASVPILLASVSGRRAVPSSILGQSLARLGARAVPRLLEGLREGDSDQQAMAAEALGLQQAVAAVPELALATAGRSGDSGAARLEVRIRAARALGRIGDPRGLAALLEALAERRDPSCWPLRAVAARALGELGDPAAVPALRAALEDERREVVTNAATALTRCGPAGVAALRDLDRAPEAIAALAMMELER